MISISNICPIAILKPANGECYWRWAGILFGSRKSSKPEKCSKMPQNPQRPVHTLLGSTKLGRLYSTSTIIYTEAAKPIGKLATPTAVRVCLPASPKTSTTKSDAPFMALA